MSASFVFFKSFADSISKIRDDSVQLAMYRAIVCYGLCGTLPSFEEIDPTGTLDAAFVPMQFAIDESKKRREQRSAAGKLGGAPKGNTNSIKNKQNQSKTSKIKPNINKNVNVNESSEEDVKESSNEPKKEVSLDPPLSQGLESFYKWLESKCPYIYKHLTLPTEMEFKKLLQSYTKEEIAETCAQIENRSDLRKTYTNLYRTILNWLKRNHQRLKS